MKWISIVAGFAFLMGLAMVREGQVANSMKAENREALIIYGILICFLCGVWLAIHGLTLLVRQCSPEEPPDSNAT